MSTLRHLYSSKVEVLRLNLDFTDGVATQSWDKLQTIVDPFLGVPGEMLCRLDLSFQRPGKDQPMPVVAGRAPDRVGLMFFDVTDMVLDGDRVHCLEGPISGTFEMRVKADPAVDYNSAHHLEVQIVEVAKNSSVNFLNNPGE